jgi:hypothetical protein
VLSCSAAAIVGCLTVDEVQTPNADIMLSDEAATGSGGSPASSSSCSEQGWALVRIADRDQLPMWSAPVLAPSCSTAPHRLTALAPRTGNSLSLEISPRTGQVVEASYSTTSTGADGEPWGEYVAPVDVERLTLNAASSPAEQPFELAGIILGPFGPVPIRMIGCARVRLVPC